MMSNIEIQMTLDGIKNQYPAGDELVSALARLADQAIAANILTEQNSLLQLENDRMRTKLFSLGITQF